MFWKWLKSQKKNKLIAGLSVALWDYKFSQYTQVKEMHHTSAIMFHLSFPILIANYIIHVRYVKWGPSNPKLKLKALVE